MELSDLPRNLIIAILQFVDHTSLLQLEIVNRHVRDIILHGDMGGIGTTSGSSPVNSEFSVLRQVRECSSVDHINESADNTLTRSHCDIGVTLLHHMAVADDPVQFVAMAKRLQRVCGCAREQPCYWSSASTWECTSTDHLDYILWANCLVNSVQIVPYRVFWYPDSPTYAPKRLSFALYELGDDDDVETLVYESITYCIANDMKMKTFELPRRAFLSRGILRLNLFDRQEDISSGVARWMQEFNLPPYYTCLSYVGVTGLLEFELSLE
ncbi:unnamed protein product [Peronospora farinosa]|uniref:F-box domain-containing protein n=1 Tax=Peronospora farinosa TaxID=134698 RepID=A0AAV0UB20_9STRA|nr:unnamed protein product [Peronospora farinosa]CAI5732129.1 unnamed protein product [Peronospora farinosa]